MLVAELTSDKPSSSTPHNDRIVGYAVYYYTYSMLQGRSLFLEDLCVKEEYRSKCAIQLYIIVVDIVTTPCNLTLDCGIGTALMQECAKVSDHTTRLVDHCMLPTFPLHQKLNHSCVHASVM